ncbi:MAG: hypothetical protein OER88_11810, partial [Planctomycetota bacterium]|nr:hypothetical protein [Planctomycetota bacterium]
LLFECNLCGNLDGDDDAVARIAEMRAGRERGLDDEVIPLVTAMELAEVFRIVKASGGDPKTNDAPYVMFRLTKNDMTYIERLLRSIEMANRTTRLRWLVELSLQNTIVYIVRPRFWMPPSDISPDDIQAAVKDLGVIARQLRRDLSLSWWR